MDRPPSRSLFRNRWVTLLWAIGICLIATEVVDGISGVTVRADQSGDTATAEPAGSDGDDPFSRTQPDAPPPPVPIPQSVER